MYLYLEQAEMGQGVAALNAALLMEKFDIFDTDRTLLGQLAAGVLDMEPSQSQLELLRQSQSSFFQGLSYH